MVDPWFDPNTFGAWYGAIGGSAGGLLGGIIGTLAGVLAPQGRGRGLVLGSMWLSVLLGLLSLVFGLAALVAGQPYGIWYPPLLVGAIMSIVVGCLIPVVQRRYTEAEHRKIDAAELRHA